MASTPRTRPRPFPPRRPQSRICARYARTSVRVSATIAGVPTRVRTEGELEQGVRRLDADQDGPQQLRAGVAAEVSGEEFAEPAREAPVGVVRRLLGGRRGPEVDQGEAGHGPLHRQVLVQHRVDGPAPVVGGEGAEPGGDALGVEVQVAQREGFDQGPLVGEEAVDGADGHLGAQGDVTGGELLVTGLVEQSGAGVEYPGEPVGAALLHGGAAEVRVRVGRGPMMPWTFRAPSASPSEATPRPGSASGTPRMARSMPLTRPPPIPTVSHRIRCPADSRASWAPGVRDERHRAGAEDGGGAGVLCPVSATSTARRRLRGRCPRAATHPSARRSGCTRSS
ncbi:hypothetical protein SMICM17S_01934 [Streptomyces microflavus]